MPRSCLLSGTCIPWRRHGPPHPPPDPDSARSGVIPLGPGRGGCGSGTDDDRRGGDDTRCQSNYDGDVLFGGRLHHGRVWLLEKGNVW